MSDMDIDNTACIVAIPDPDSVPAGTNDPHITIAYLGEPVMSGDEVDQIRDLLNAIWSGEFTEPVTGFDFLGEDKEAHVALLGGDNLKIIRDSLLQTEIIADRVAEAEKWPEYTPHLTLGYTTDEGYEGHEEPDPDMKEVRVIGLALWNGTDQSTQVPSPEVVTAAAWLEHLHPRGKDGKFIKKYGIIKFLNLLGGWEYGKVIGMSPKAVTANPNAVGGIKNLGITIQPSDLHGNPTGKPDVTLPASKLYAAPTPKAMLTTTGMKKVGGQAGSNPGGLFEVESGPEWGKDKFTGAHLQNDPDLIPVGVKVRLEYSDGTQVDNVIYLGNKMFAVGDMDVPAYLNTHITVLDGQKTAPEKFYVKKAKSATHGYNEMLANALYEEAGVYVPEVSYNPVNGQIFSKIVDGKMDASSHIDGGDEEWLDKVREDFVVDAWLANWDVFGLTNDNILTTPEGTPVRIDAGGALLFRAQGGPKGNQFGGTVGELQTLRNKRPKVYGNMSVEQELDGAKRVLAISPARIEELVAEHNLPKSLADTLKARRAYIAEHYNLPLPESVKPVESEYPTSAPLVDPLEDMLGGGMPRTWSREVGNLFSLASVVESGDQIRTSKGITTVGMLKVSGESIDVFDHLTALQSEGGPFQLQKAGNAPRITHGAVYENISPDVTGQLANLGWQRGDRISLDGNLLNVLGVNRENKIMLVSAPQQAGSDAPAPFVLNLLNLKAKEVQTLRWNPEITATPEPAGKSPTAEAVEETIKADLVTPIPNAGPAPEPKVAVAEPGEGIGAPTKDAPKKMILGDGTMAQTGDKVVSKFSGEFTFIKPKGPYAVVEDESGKQLLKKANTLSQPGKAPAAEALAVKATPKAADGKEPTLGMVVKAKDGKQGEVVMISPDGKFLFFMFEGKKIRKSTTAVTSVGVEEGGAPEPQFDPPGTPSTTQGFPDVVYGKTSLENSTAKETHYDDLGPNDVVWAYHADGTWHLEPFLGQPIDSLIKGTVGAYAIAVWSDSGLPEDKEMVTTAAHLPPIPEGKAYGTLIEGKLITFQKEDIGPGQTTGFTVDGDPWTFNSNAQILAFQTDKVHAPKSSGTPKVVLTEGEIYAPDVYNWDNSLGALKTAGKLQSGNMISPDGENWFEIQSVSGNKVSLATEGGELFDLPITKYMTTFTVKEQYNVVPETPAAPEPTIEAANGGTVVPLSEVSKGQFVFHNEHYGPVVDILSDGTLEFYGEDGVLRSVPNYEGFVESHDDALYCPGEQVMNAVAYTYGTLNGTVTLPSGEDYNVVASQMDASGQIYLLALDSGGDWTTLSYSQLVGKEVIFKPTWGDGVEDEWVSSWKKTIKIPLDSKAMLGYLETTKGSQPTKQSVYLANDGNYYRVTPAGSWTVWDKDEKDWFGTSSPDLDGLKMAWLEAANGALPDASDDAQGPSSAAPEPKVSEYTLPDGKTPKPNQKVWVVTPQGSSSEEVHPTTLVHDAGSEVYEVYAFTSHGTPSQKSEVDKNLETMVKSGFVTVEEVYTGPEYGEAPTAFPEAPQVSGFGNDMYIDWGTKKEPLLSGSSVYLHTEMPGAVLVGNSQYDTGWVMYHANVTNALPVALKTSDLNESKLTHVAGPDTFPEAKAAALDAVDSATPAPAPTNNALTYDASYTKSFPLNDTEGNPLSPEFKAAIAEATNEFPLPAGHSLFVYQSPSKPGVSVYYAHPQNGVSVWAPSQGYLGLGESVWNYQDMLDKGYNFVQVDLAGLSADTPTLPDSSLVGVPADPNTLVPAFDFDGPEVIASANGFWIKISKAAVGPGTTEITVTAKWDSASSTWTKNAVPVTIAAFTDSLQMVPPGSGVPSSTGTPETPEASPAASPLTTDAAAWGGDLLKGGQVPKIGMGVYGKGPMVGTIVSISKDKKKVTVLTSDGKKSQRLISALQYNPTPTMNKLGAVNPVDIPETDPIVGSIKEVFEKSFKGSDGLTGIANMSPDIIKGYTVVTDAVAPSGKKYVEVIMSLTREKRKAFKKWLESGPVEATPVPMGDWVQGQKNFTSIAAGDHVSMRWSNTQSAWVPNKNATPKATHIITEVGPWSDGEATIKFHDVDDPNVIKEAVVKANTPNGHPFKVHTYTWDPNKPAPLPPSTDSGGVKVGALAASMGWSKVTDNLFSNHVIEDGVKKLLVEPGKPVSGNKAAYGSHQDYHSNAVRAVMSDGTVIEVANLGGSSNKSTSGMVKIMIPEGGDPVQAYGGALAALGMEYVPVTQESVKKQALVMLRGLVNVDHKDLETLKGETEESLFNKVGQATGLTDVGWHDVSVRMDKGTGAVAYYWSDRVREKILAKNQWDIIIRGAKGTDAERIVGVVKNGSPATNIRMVAGLGGNGISIGEDNSKNTGAGSYMSGGKISYASPSGKFFNTNKFAMGGGGMMVWQHREAILGRIIPLQGAHGHSDLYGTGYTGDNFLKSATVGDAKTHSSDLYVGGGIGSESVGLITVQSASERDKAIKRLKAEGITHLNGQPLESVIFTFDEVSGKKIVDFMPKWEPPTDLIPITDLPTSL